MIWASPPALSPATKDVPSLFSTARIERNWENRKVQILVSGSLSAIFGGIALSCFLSPIVVTLAGLSMVCFAKLVHNLIRTPEPIAPRKIQSIEHLEMLMPFIVIGGLYASTNFRTGFLIGFLHCCFFKGLVDLNKSKSQKPAPRYEQMSDHAYIHDYRSSSFWTSIMAPIYEEIACRGILQTISSYFLGSSYGLVTASVIFGALHGPNNPENLLSSCFQPTSLGLIAGSLYNYYGLTAAIAAHMAHNLFVYLDEKPERDREFRDFCKLRNYEVLNKFF